VTRKLLVVIGTRPEAIKLAPVVLEARRRPDAVQAVVVVTSQHREMLSQMLAQFSIVPDVDLDVMQPDQELARVTVAALEGLDEALRAHAPDCVVVQGDTTTTFVGALAASYHRIPVAHVEAGLRTGDRTQPWPEEINRCLTSQLTHYHFAPTERARENLLREGFPDAAIWVTGNTAIDALLHTVERSGARRRPRPGGRRSVLLTAHRRESHGAPLEEICAAVLRLVDRHPEVDVIYPVHKSPRVREVAFARLADHPRIELIEPLDYVPFVQAMLDADLILTDSGGVQEEASALGTPVLVLRGTTERPEALDAGAARLVGTDADRIVTEASRLLEDEAAREAMAGAVSPFGDGRAAERIVDVLAKGPPRAAVRGLAGR
jgi:UDP-N-acetylglucosamine 2-epimerase (non-hydrolysing)